jgi:nucleotide-binding universal stress UspA family protein
MFRQVVVGVDEHGVDQHGGGRDAIALAQMLLEPDGELTLAHVYAGNPEIARVATPSYELADRNRALELLERARERAQVEASLRAIGAHSVGRGLHELAEREAADLLVLGSCRRGLIGRVLLEDDTRAALNGAPCALAIAPAGYSENPAPMRKVGVGYDGSPESTHALELARNLARDLGGELSAFTAISVPVTALGPGPLHVRDTIDELVTGARDRIAALGGVEPHAAYGEIADELAVYSGSLDLLIVGSRGYGPVGRLIHGSTSHRLARLARCPLLVLPRAA